MRSRALVFAILAIVLAGITVLFAGGRFGGQGSGTEQEQSVAKAYVLVAARDLPTGLLLHPDDFIWQAWPAEKVNDAYLEKDRDDAGTMAGAVVRLRIGKGEPISVSRVIKPGERGFLAAVLGPGMRATSVVLTAATDVAGLILPGDHVDLILSHTIKDERDPNAAPKMVSETVLTDLRVVAIDQIVNDLDKKPISGKTGTFEVTPKQAEMIEVAKMLGNLSLVLRSVAGDQSVLADAGSDLAADAKRGSATDVKFDPATALDNDNSKEPPSQRADGSPVEVTHTWDSDLSPLIRHRAPGSDSPAEVVILRGSVAGGSSGASDNKTQGAQR